MSMPDTNILVFFDTQIHWVHGANAQMANTAGRNIDNLAPQTPSVPLSTCASRSNGGGQ